MSAHSRVLEALSAHGSKGRGTSWQCIAHEDRAPSLSVTNGAKGVVIHCHAGCATEDVVSALGLTMADLFDEPLERPERRTVVKSYPYPDASGVIRYYADRYVPKDFRPRMADGSQGFPKNVRILYNLPAVLAQAAAAGTIFVVEGEKDADNLTKTGAVATTMPGGTGMGWLEPYTDSLDGAAEVVIIADNDKSNPKNPGVTHARKVAASLKARGIPHRIMLPAVGKDISDHLAAKYDFDDLVPLEEAETRTAPPQNDSSNSSEALWAPEDASAGIGGTEKEGGGPCWDPPIPVPRNQLPPFPTDLLGGSLATWVRAQGAALNVSDDLLAFSSLASVSAALGGRVQVRVKDGWETENVCLYCLGLADSSARKTPALDAAMAPMRERIGKFRDDLRAEVDENEQMIRITEKELAAVENDVSRGKKTQDDARAVLDTLRDLRDTPGLPKAFVGDVTLEALGKVMGENGGRMALMESEAGFFKACAGLYGNGRADITLVLKAYSGTGHEIDRVGRGNSWMPRTALTLALIIQPGVVEHLEKENPEFKSSGFLNRFLCALPVPMPPGTFDTPGVPDQVAADYAQRLVRLVDDIWSSENIRTLTLTANARKKFADFYNQIEQDKVDGGKLHDIAEWAGKLCGQIIRLAACLALYENAAVAEIDEQVMERAIGLAPYLVAHARAAFDLMSRDGDGGRKLLRDILDRLPQLLDDADNKTVTLRKIRESFKGRRANGHQGAVDAEAVKDAMDELEDLGWVAEIPSPPRKPGQRGQKASPKYDVHPWIYAPPKETA